jgi:S1-C subfamily serine protease
VIRSLCLCLISSLLASALTVVWLSPPGSSAAVADIGRPRGASPVEQVRPSLVRTFDLDGLTPDEAITVAVYEAVNRSVVNITSKATQRGVFLELQAEGAGSGAVIDTQGHIVTNYHVVQDAKQIQVALHNGETYEATQVGADPLNDLAVIKIEAPTEELYPVTLGDSRDLKVGMRVFALGNPFGLERTLTTGIISSLNRSLQIRGNWTIRSIIQIDAAINPGSSGGPLLDAHGRLIGINTAIATTSGQSAGVGFAIPVSLVRRVVPQLVQHGRVIRPETGIITVFQTEEGLLINELKPNGPAAKAGLKGPVTTRSRRGPFTVERVDKSKADIIIEVDDQKVESPEDFLGYVDEKQPGEEVILTILRNGQRTKVPLTLTTSESTPSN